MSLRHRLMALERSNSQYPVIVLAAPADATTEELERLEREALANVGIKDSKDALVVILRTFIERSRTIRIVSNEH